MITLTKKIWTPEKSKLKFVIVTTTYSNSVNDFRAGLALKTVEAAKKEGYEIVVVDGSPDEKFKDALTLAGAHVFMEKTKGDYVQAGANQMSKEQQAQREKLQGLEKFLFPQSRSGIPGQVKAAPVGGLQPWSVGSDYPTSVIGIGNGSRVQYQPRNFSTGKEGSRYDTYMDAERERAQMLDEFHRTLVPKYR